MENFFRSALSSLPTVASSPLAFIAYLCLVGSWLAIALKVRRNKNILKHLDKIPTTDRLRVLQLEMGAIHLKSGFTPEQWMRARIHHYYFLGFVLLCLVIIVIFVIATVVGNRDAQGNAEADMTLDSSNGSTATSRRFLFDDDRLQYSYRRIGDVIEVSPDAPYLSLLFKGGPIRKSDHGFRKWSFPKLSVKIVNNTTGTLLIDEASILVRTSEINREPLLTVTSTDNYLVLFNEGWGDVVNPHIDLGITKMSSEGKDPATLFEGSKLSVDEQSFSESMQLRISDFVPDHLKDEFQVQVFGELKYETEDSKNRSVKFIAPVSLKRTITKGSGYSPPSHLYEVLLEPGKSGYTKRVPLSQEIRPGATDVFTIQIGAVKSASFDLEFSFRAVGGIRLPGNRFVLDLLVPRSAIRRLRAIDTIVGQVTKVVDGCTIVVRDSRGISHTIELHGIYAPDQDDILSLLAQQTLRLLILGKTIKVRFIRPDDQGRVTGVAMLGTIDIGLKQVRAGLAGVDLRDEDELTEKDIYQEAETSARTAGVGLWRE
jgi:endonuclease YncB( thermonuclease family)